MKDFNKYKINLGLPKNIESLDNVLYNEAEWDLTI